jgi:hypothetical protein
MAGMHMRFRSERALRVLLFILTALSGCSVATLDVQPLKIDAFDFKAQITTICLNPLADLKPDEDADEEIQAKLKAIDALIVNELKQAGFTTVEPELVQAAWERAGASEGGCVDVHTGRADIAKCEAIRTRWRKDLKEDLGCDAVLTPAIAVVRAPWNNGMARWDGAEQTLGAGVGSYGYVAALSLSVALHDIAGEEIYYNTGGIQTLATLNSGFWSHEFETVPHDQLLSSPGRNLIGVHAALADLPRRPPADGQPPSADHSGGGS